MAKNCCRCSVKWYTSINQSVLLLIQIVPKYDQLMFMSCFAKENLRCLIHWGHFLINEIFDFMRSLECSPYYVYRLLIHETVVIANLRRFIFIHPGRLLVVSCIHFIFMFLFRYIIERFFIMAQMSRHNCT